MSPDRVLASARPFLLPVMLGAAVFLGFLAWLDAGSYRVMAGDDLFTFSETLRGLGSYPRALATVHRFRPVTALLLWGACKAAGGGYRGLLLIGVGLHTANALVFWRILSTTLRLSPGWAAGLTLVAALNRFVSYAVFPCCAITEGAGVLFCLLFVWALLRVSESGRLTPALLSVLAFAAMIHAHERYVVLSIASVAAAALVWKRNRAAAVVTASGPLVLIAANYMMKAVVLRIPPLTGAGLTVVGFHPRSVAHFVVRAAANIGGLNWGPSYLSVLDFAESPTWLRDLSLASLACAVAVLMLGLLPAQHRPTQGTSEAPGRITVLLGVVTAALILTSSITFMQEYRWMYPAYLTFLMLLAHVARHAPGLPRGRLATAALAGFMIIAVPRETGIRSQRDNFYARSAYNKANNLYSLLRRNPDLLGARVIVVGGDPVEAADWVFFQGASSSYGDSFSHYYDIPPLRFTPGHPAGTGADEPTVVFDRRTGNFERAPGSR